MKHGKSMKTKLYERYSNVENRTLFFLNLTNGLEAYTLLKDMELPEDKIRFSCIQSAHLESASIDAMLNRMGPDLLMELALGTRCVIIDYGTDKEISRAIYQGVPFIKYALERKWFGRTPESVLIRPRREDGDTREAIECFKRWYSELDHKTKKYIAKFGQYAKASKIDDVKIEGVSANTVHDGHPEYYIQIVAEEISQR